MDKKNIFDKALDAVAEVGDALVDTGSQVLDKVSSPTSRSGIVVERVGKMAKGGVAPEAIAAQLSSGSATNHKYTVEQVKGFKALFEDCHTKVPVTKAAAEALIADSKDNPAPDGNTQPT